MGVFGIDPDKRVDVPNGLRRTGVTGGKGIFDKYMNQILFELKTNQIWGTEAQVKAVPPEATFYTDGSGDRFDKNDVAVVINEDDKILVAHDVTATANHVLDCGGKKVTLEMSQGVTWNLDTFDLTLGGTGDSIGGSIRITQTGSLSIVGNRGLSINSSVDTYSDFVTKNLIINVQSNTTVAADADNIVFVDEFGGGKRVDNINETFDITSVTHGTPDLMSGTSEKASTWYQMWLDSEGVRLLVPDLEGTADGDVENELIDPAADFGTDRVQIGDIVYNLTDLTQATVTEVNSSTIITLSSDIFPDGNEDYKIRLLSPTGLGNFKARIGAAFNNSVSNFDDSTYTQIQETRFYSELDGDFDITSAAANYGTVDSQVRIFQVTNWTGLGQWMFGFVVSGTHDSATTASMTFSGTVFKNNTIQPVVLSPSSQGLTQQANGSSGTISLSYVAGRLNTRISGLLICQRKPDYAK